MPDKPTVAFYWCASCGGCEEAIVDLAEDLLTVADAVDIVLWPVALDVKKRDVEAMADGAITVAFVNGAVRLTEQQEWAHLLRRKAQTVIAFGTCAHLGGIPGLANFTTRAEIVETVYHGVPSLANADGVEPLERTEIDGEVLTLPALDDRVRALDQVIPVDYYVPGCAPPRDLVLAAVTALLEGRLPPRGSVLAPSKACCEVCPRKDTKPERLEITEIKRVATSTPDSGTCLLAQGYVCMGPATRAGCGERCIHGNMPCRGCFGPPDGVRDQGAKFLSAFASVLAPRDEAAIDALVATVPDPAGTFYRFSLPAAILRRRHDGVES